MRNNGRQNKTAYTCCKACFISERKRGKRDRKITANSREGSREHRVVDDQEVHAYYVGTAARADATVVSDDHPRLTTGSPSPRTTAAGIYE